MDLTDSERAYLQAARLGRLATADAEGRPHVVPICYAIDSGTLVSPIDEKPKSVDPDQLRRARDIRSNRSIALLIDHYSEEWSQLGWLQLRGQARLEGPETSTHRSAIQSLRSKYEQYQNHALEARPLLRIRVTNALSWGRLNPEAVR